MGGECRLRASRGHLTAADATARPVWLKPGFEAQLIAGVRVRPLST